MRSPSRRAIRRASILLLLAGLAVAIPALVQSSTGAVQVAGVADTETFDLCASEGAIDLPGAAGTPIWGFSLDPGTGCEAAALPGPMLNVDVGDVVTVNLQNNLAEDVSIVFPGQDLIPNAVVVPAGGSDSYTFTASDPGTYLYEAGTNTAVQVGMGLYGALVVRPLTAGQAYGPTTAYNVEQILVLSEVDPHLNADPNGFDFVGDHATYTAGYHPTYFLINGEAYGQLSPVGPQNLVSSAAESASYQGTQDDEITAAPGDEVLLRYVNAGLSHHTMTLLGDHQSVIAKDAYPTGTNAYEAVAETIPAGSTLDAIVADVTAGRYPLYSRNLDVTNDGAYPGGMLTFLEVS